MKWFYDQKLLIQILSAVLLVGTLGGVVGVVGIGGIRRVDSADTGSL